MIRICQDFIPKDRHNRPGFPIVPAYITIHDTGNANKGADARGHASYVKSDAAAKAEVSWHFTVDDELVIQHLPLNEGGWHATDGSKGPGNSTSIGIEICENKDGDRAKAEENAAQLTAFLLRVFGLGADKVVPHRRWYPRKQCPHLLLPRWDAFIERVGRILENRDTFLSFVPPSVGEEVLRKRIAELEAQIAAGEATIKRIKEFVAAV